MNLVNLGTIQITRTHKRANGMHYEFEGLYSDLSKLQAASSTEYFEDMVTGSTAILYNPTAVYKYEKSNNTWHAL